VRDLGIAGYIGTPSFLKLIVEKADELKADISSLRKAHVGAEYLPPALRQAMLGRGIRVTQSYGTATWVRSPTSRSGRMAPSPKA